MNCFLCTRKALRKYSTVVKVEAFPLVRTLINCCLNQGDIWGNEVHTRLLSCSDLLVEEAIYHISCMNRFWLQKNTNYRSSGRPIVPAMMRNFERVCQ